MLSLTFILKCFFKISTGQVGPQLKLKTAALARNSKLLPVMIFFIFPA